MIKVFLDANILYSNAIRSYLIWLHVNKVIEIYWSIEVWEEAFTGYGRSHGEPTTIRFRTSMTKNAIAGYPKCLVRIAPMNPLGLKDPDDEHVVAAAATCKADYLVTNDRVLQGEDLSSYRITQISPDDLLSNILAKSHPLGLVQSAKDHIQSFISHEPSKRKTDKICQMA